MEHTPHPTLTTRERPALSPTAAQLLRLLRAQPLDERARTANTVYAGQLGRSTRSITKALTELRRAGLVVIRHRRGHPVDDPVGRTLLVVDLDGPEAMADLDIVEQRRRDAEEAH